MNYRDDVEGGEAGVLQRLLWSLTKQSKFSGLGVEKEKPKCTAQCENS